MQRGRTKFLCLIGDSYIVKFSLNYSSITYIDSMKTLIFRLADFNYVLVERVWRKNLRIVACAFSTSGKGQPLWPTIKLSLKAATAVEDRGLSCQ